MQYARFLSSAFDAYLLAKSEGCGSLKITAIAPKMRPKQPTGLTFHHVSTVRKSPVTRGCNHLMKGYQHHGFIAFFFFLPILIIYDRQSNLMLLSFRPASTGRHLTSSSKRKPTLALRVYECACSNCQKRDIHAGDRRLSSAVPTFIKFFLIYGPLHHLLYRANST